MEHFFGFYGNLIKQLFTKFRGSSIESQMVHVQITTMVMDSEKNIIHWSESLLFNMDQITVMVPKILLQTTSFKPRHISKNAVR